MKIPFLNLEPQHTAIKREMTQAFNELYDSHHYILGSRLTAFEKGYSNFNRTRHTIGVSNGLDALYLSLKALGIGEGDEVIVPSNTYIASLLAVTFAGALPVPVEPDIRTYNINPDRIEPAITGKTRAIMPVHLYGQSCEMDKIATIAKKRNLFIVEDNAQGHGATFNGKLTGSWGNSNGTSFYPTKNLGALGDGGAVTTDDDDVAERVLLLRNYGSRVKYINEVAGNNMRLDELQAAFLSVKLKYLMEWNSARKEIAGIYLQRLQDVREIILPSIHPSADHVFHIFNIRSSRRDQLQAYLNEKGIGTMIHYPIPPHLQQAYSNLSFKKGDFPIAEEISDTCLSLPLWPGMEIQHVEEVADAIKRFFAR